MSGSRPVTVRALRFEPLEERRLLAVLMVTSPLDVVANDGAVTLREAINAANTDTALETGTVASGNDTIRFASALSGQSISLASELFVTEAITIDGSMLASKLTVNPAPNSRVITFNDAPGPFLLRGFNLNGNVSAGRDLSITDSIISGNTNPNLGGVSVSGDLYMARCVVDNNEGPGIACFGSITMHTSTISNNRHKVAGPPPDFLFSGAGGGIYAEGDVNITYSLITGNIAGSTGGGIFALGDVTLTNSTINGNTASSNTGNYQRGLGGGIYGLGNITVSSSTITSNQALNGKVSQTPPLPPVPGQGSGGGIWNSLGSITIRNSIVAQNSAVFQNSFDIFDGGGAIAVNYSLIGSNGGTTLPASPVGAPDANGNFIGNSGSLINPGLQALRNNGGTILTRALLAGSLAINSGDPAAVAGMGGVPTNDQRGLGFTRVAVGRIDMGSYELQVIPTLPDYSKNGVVDTADYIVWRNSQNETVTPLSGADGNGNGTVDQFDYNLWRQNFGKTVAATTSEISVTQVIAPDAVPVVATVAVDSTEETTEPRIFASQAASSVRNIDASNPTTGVTSVFVSGTSRNDLLLAISRPTHEHKEPSFRIGQLSPADARPHADEDATLTEALDEVFAGPDLYL